MEVQILRISGRYWSGSSAVTRSCLVAKVIVALSIPSMAAICSSILEAQWAQPRFSRMYTFVIFLPDVPSERGVTLTCDSMEVQILRISGRYWSGSSAVTRSCLVAKVIVAPSIPPMAAICSSILEAQ